MSKKIAVIAKRLDIAIEFVDRLIGDISIKELDHVSSLRNSYDVYMKNGDVYRAYIKPSFPEVLRGIKWNEIYIHKAIDEEYRKKISIMLNINAEFFEI